VLPCGNTQPWGVNPEDNSRVGAPKAFHGCLQPCSSSFCNDAAWCQTVTAPLFVWIHQRHGEGDKLHGQQPAFYRINTQTYSCEPSHLRGHSSFIFCEDTTQGAADTCNKLLLSWCRARHKKLLLTVQEIFFALTG